MAVTCVSQKNVNRSKGGSRAKLLCQPVAENERMSALHALVMLTSWVKGVSADLVREACCKIQYR